MIKINDGALLADTDAIERQINAVVGPTIEEEIEKWSLAKQSGIYFAITCAVMLPIAYVANWMQHSLVGILSYFGVFVAIFIFVWAVQYFCWKIKIRKMNERIKENNDTK